MYKKILKLLCLHKIGVKVLKGFDMLVYIDDREDEELENHEDDDSYGYDYGYEYEEQSYDYHEGDADSYFG